ncbi:MAG: SAM hydrolase/SAM-dependent halogenase family protein [Gammaproteobacteria bacterium]
MIVLFTDYGLQGPYIGQVQAMLSCLAPAQRVITLFPDLPQHNPRAAAYLLAAFSSGFPEDTIFFCVVDPGVGGFADDPVILKLDHRRYVGPDNGLFDLVARHASAIECHRIDWRPQQLSYSFHGRDLYAPVCAMLANKVDILAARKEWRDRHRWPDDLDEIVYIDIFGNSMTGRRAGMIVAENNLILENNHIIGHAHTFTAVPAGQAFWYENSNGLVEIAVNGGNAQQALALNIGSRFRIS